MHHPPDRPVDQRRCRLGLAPLPRALYACRTKPQVRAFCPNILIWCTKCGSMSPPKIGRIPVAEADHYLSKGEVAVALDELEAQFARWALAHPDIRAVMVVGSRARQDHPADEWADLDLIIFTTDVRHYLSSSDWMQSLGNVWVASQGKTVRGDPEWLVTLEGGYDADFVFTSSGQLRWALRALALLRRSPQLKRALPPAVEAIIAEFHSGASDVFARGVRVMLDRDRLIRDMRRLFRDRPPANQVTEDSFLSAVNSFWLTAGRAAKKLRRGELWVA